MLTDLQTEFGRLNNERTVHNSAMAKSETELQALKRTQETLLRERDSYIDEPNWRGLHNYAK